MSWSRATRYCPFTGQQRSRKTLLTGLASWKPVSAGSAACPGRTRIWGYNGKLHPTESISGWLQACPGWSRVSPEHPTTPQRHGASPSPVPGKITRFPRSCQHHPHRHGNQASPPQPSSDGSLAAFCPDSDHRAFPGCEAGKLR